MKYYFNLGSNLGNKPQNLNEAIALLEKELHTKAKRSSIVESEPWGFESENSFMNIGIIMESNIAPLEMLKIIKRIERKMGSEKHRNQDNSYCDRLIDIDIITVDNIQINTPELTIPHPRMLMRDFVMLPLKELNPDWTHPDINK